MTLNYLLQRTRWSGHPVFHHRARRAFEQKRYARLGVERAHVLN